MCDYPRAWHKQTPEGDWVLDSYTRSTVGNRVPPVCWRKPRGESNLNHPKMAFLGGTVR